MIKDTGYQTYNEQSWLLLTAAMQDNMNNVVKILEKEKYVNINVKSDHDSAIICAISSGNNKMLEYLLKKGADPNIKLSQHTYPLIFAIYRNNLTAVLILLDYGADVNIRHTERNITSLHLIAEKNLSLGLFMTLLLSGADTNLQDDEGYSVLSTVASYGRDNMLQELILGCSSKYPINFSLVNNKGENFLDVIKYGSVNYIMTKDDIQRKVLNNAPELITFFKKYNLLHPDVKIEFTAFNDCSELNLL